MPASSETLAAAKADFDRDGYAVIRGFQTTDEVQQLEEEISRYVRDILPHQPSDAAFYEDKSHPETLFRLSCLQDFSSYFAQIPKQERFVDLSAMLLKDTVVSKGIQLFGKAPRVGNETPSHQDGYYFTLEPNEALTVWLPLDRTDEENGSICYVPGSHKRGLLPHGRGDTFGFSQGLLDYTDEDRATEVTIVADPGDLIVHHSLTIHRADPNRSDRRRWAIGLVYYAGRAKVDTAAREARDRVTKEEWEAAGKV